MKTGKKYVAWLLATAMLGVLTGCAGKPAVQSSSGGASEKSTAPEKKQDLVMIIASANSEVSKNAEKMVLDKFGDKYNIIVKTWDDATIEQTVKTAAAANEQLDLVQYWPNSMNTFTSADLAVDLTEYMDDEWASIFNPGALDIGTYDGKLYNVPYNIVYPMIIANTDITDAAGIELPDEWTWEEFVEINKQIIEKTDAFGSGINQAWANWLVRNGLMQTWDTNEELNAWNAGQVAFTDDKVVNTMERVKSVFDQGLFYPGEGALAVTLDQANAAFAQGKFAFMFNVNTVATSAIRTAGIQNYKIMDWPKMGNNPTNPLLGGCDGYFIPKSVKNMEGALEVMKYLTSEEVLTMRIKAGQVPPVDIKVEGLDEAHMQSISRGANQVYPTEIINLSSEISQFISNEMPANYIYNGKSALDELEALRKAATNK